MIYRSEACNTHGQLCFVDQLSQLEATLTEISVAALTTEPELRDMARSLISLAKYHAQTQELERTCVSAFSSPSLVGTLTSAQSGFHCLGTQGAKTALSNRRERIVG